MSSKKKQIGILTHPSATFYYSFRRKRQIKVKYDDLPEETKTTKCVFPKFMNGSLTEVYNIKEELTVLGDIEIALKIDGTNVIPDNSELSPSDYFNDVSKYTISLKHWSKSKEVIILILSKDEFDDMDFKPLKNKKVIICSSVNAEPELRNKLGNVLLYCPRKGVARVDKVNRKRIFETLQNEFANDNY
jgi:hypothetical protein